jgi:hypothetical protein
MERVNERGATIKALDRQFVDLSRRARSTAAVHRRSMMRRGGPATG